MKHKCVDEIKIQTERLLQIKKRIENAKDKRATSTLRKKMEGLSQEMDELNNRIAQEAELENNMKGSSMRLTHEEFERYSQVRDDNGAV